MAEITIGSVSYTSYAERDAADSYAAAALHADSWREADVDTKDRALVTATRILDRQVWKDAYNTFALRAAVDAIVHGAIELALALVDGAEVQNEVNSQKITSLQAGPVSLTFMPGAEGQATRFPKIVQELLGPYLAGSDVTLASKATGVCGESIYPLDFKVNAGF